jgi:hypothetical protein
MSIVSNDDKSDKSKLDLSHMTTLPSLDEAPTDFSTSEASPLEISPPGEPLQFQSLEDFSLEEQPGTTSEAEQPSEPQPEFHADPASPGLDLVSAQDLSSPTSTTRTLTPDLAPDLGPDSNSPGNSMDSIKQYSENLAAQSTQVGAAFPFTLKIEGKLPPEDAEKLLSILTRENMGFREVDLESQLAEGRILIPRISEYAGIVLIQALRGIPALMQFGPSDEIFSTPDTRDEHPSDSSTHWSPDDEKQADSSFEEIHAAENMPVTNAASFPQFQEVSAIDTVIATGLLSTRSVEATHSREYEKLLEALMRELKFKAHRRGANGIFALLIQLTPLTLPTDYRVTITGTAVLGK